MDIESNKSLRGPIYTSEMTRNHTFELLKESCVRHSANADCNGILGYTPGWSSSTQFSRDTHIPPQPLYGYTITDDTIDEEQKITMIVTAGNHGHEYTGDWILRGLADFLTSTNREAQALRKNVLFCFYPNINPEARFMSVNEIYPESLAVPAKDCAKFPKTHCRGNPELYQAGEDDHNRVWTNESKFTTIVLLIAAMRADTGGKADYLWDLHGPQEIGNWRSPQKRDSWECPYGKALQKREPEVITAALPESSYKPGVSFPPGKLCVWAHAYEGLNIPHTYVYEPGLWNKERLMDAGRNLAMALHDIQK